MNNRFEYIDIILLAMIAGFIFLRLRGILGRKSGFEEKVPTNFETNFPKEILESQNPPTHRWSSVLYAYRKLPNSRASNFRTPKLPNIPKHPNTLTSNLKLRRLELQPSNSEDSSSKPRR